jgi:hypothetical protein
MERKETEKKKKGGLEILEIEKGELEHLINSDVEMVDTIYKTCRSRCVYSFEKADLNHGEINCLSRCTHKFLQINHIVKNNMQDLLHNFQPPQF